MSPDYYSQTPQNYKGTKIPQGKFEMCPTRLTFLGLSSDTAPWRFIKMCVFNGNVKNSYVATVRTRKLILYQITLQEGFYAKVLG